MNENIELEVSLEVIMSKIADAIFKLTNEPSEDNEKELERLIDIQERAYEGDGIVVSQILHGC